jgi:lycopene cyclase domain-containing protein
MNLGHATYFVWLVGCAGPILLLQWIVYHRYLRPHARAIFIPALLVGSYLSFVDSLAIADDVWGFDPRLTLGIFVGTVPLEEVLFFLLTSLLVTQGMTLFIAAFRERSTAPTPRAGAAAPDLGGDQEPADNV